jgi:hypothetical protein
MQFVPGIDASERAAASGALYFVADPSADVQAPFEVLGLSAFHAAVDETLFGIGARAVQILDAKWFEASSLPMTPPPMSISRRLIDAWGADVGAAGIPKIAP